MFDIITTLVFLVLVFVFLANANSISLWFSIRDYNKRHGKVIDPKTPYKQFAYRKNDYMLENFCNKLEVKNNENEK